MDGSLLNLQVFAPGCSKIPPEESTLKKTEYLGTDPGDDAQRDSLTVAEKKGEREEEGEGKETRYFWRGMKISLDRRFDYHCTS